MRQTYTLIVLLMIGCSDPQPTTESSLKVNELLSATPPVGYQRASQPRVFQFPDDHGPHPDYASEWWYLTGNLEGEQGQRFGYQFTLFRLGVDKNNHSKRSHWRNPDLYMAHFAVSDIKNQQHYSSERFSRGSPGVAGVMQRPFKAWLGPWQLQGTDSTFPLELNAAHESFEIRLQIGAGGKPITLQGDQGLSQKSPLAGNASYYYSMTRLPSQGQIKLNGQSLRVQGDSWLDREWSSSALAKNQVGWDWFALQLNDGSDLMFYHLRTEEQTKHPFSRGSLVDPQGNKSDLLSDDIKLTALEWWTSDEGERYPVSWRLEVPEKGIDLRVNSAIEDQLMRTSIRYWEGSVEVSGSHSGRGYMELSGY
ncbi:MAG: carotenoid 1,2-hydratase [Gammaproteobacteria bacterium]|nr:carotenoid 1,2-hydratase [Gammaproteobacteria bacterium]